MRRCVWFRNVMNEEAMARVGPQRQKKNTADIKGISLFDPFLTYT